MAYQPHVFRFGRYLWRYKLTPPGRWLVLGILMTSIGSITLEVPVYQIFCCLLALLGISEGVGLLFKPSLSLSGQLPDRSVAGSEVTGLFTLTNTSRWRPAYDVMLGLFGLPRDIRHTDADHCISQLDPQESTTISVTVATPRRGFYPLPPVQSVSTFPLNLMRFGGDKTERQNLIVLPSYEPLDEINIPVSHRYQPGGVTYTAGLGHSPEFVGNRDYIPGEEIKRIDFKAWGRVGRPVVREYQEEYYCRIALIVDTYIPPGTKASNIGFATLEAAVSLAAAITDRLNINEYVIDLFAAGPDMYVFRTIGGATHFDSVLEILAGVDACRDNPFVKISPLVIEELESISTAICLFIDWDETRSEFCNRILESGCLLKAILIRPESTTPTQSSDLASVVDWTELTPVQILNGEIHSL
ncbi:MAG: DUF58 domain-containing protein [Planctomycetaceae bacterium]